RRIVRNARLGSPAAVLIRGDMIEFQPRDATTAVADAFAALTSGPVPLLNSRPVDAEHAARGGVAFSLSEQAFEERLRGSLQNSIESMERRVRQAGVAKGLVRATGDGRILMITPGLKEPERLFQLLDSRARLAFRAVDRSADPCHVETPPADSEILRDHATKATLLVRRHVLAGGENV